MVFTEQQIKEIIAEELLLEVSLKDVSRKLKNIFSIKTKNKQPEIEQLDINNFIEEIPSEKKKDDTKLFLDYINKLHSDVNNLKTVRDRLEPDSKDYSEADKIISTMQSKISLLMQQWNEPVRQELEAEINKAHEEAIKINDKLNKQASAISPPAPPEDKEETETIGAEDLTYDVNEIYKKVASETKIDLNDIENTVKYLKNKNLLKPEVVKKLGFNETLVREIIAYNKGKKKMKLTESVVKELIKEEVKKSSKKHKRTDEAFEGIKGGLGALGTAVKQTYQGGAIQGKASKSVQDAAKQAKVLSAQITSLISQAQKLGLSASPKLTSIRNNLANASQNANDAVAKKEPLLVKSGQATPEQSQTQPSAPASDAQQADNKQSAETPGGNAPVGGVSAGGETRTAFGQKISGPGPQPPEATTATSAGQKPPDTTAAPAAQTAEPKPPEAAAGPAAVNKQKPAKYSEEAGQGLNPYRNKIRSSEGYPEDISQNEFSNIISALGGSDVLAESKEDYIKQVAQKANTTPDKVTKLLNFMEKNGLLKQDLLNKINGQASAEQKADSKKEETKEIKKFSDVKDVANFHDQLKSDKEFPSNISTATALMNILNPLAKSLGMENGEALLAENVNYDEIAKQVQGFDKKDIESLVNYLLKKNLLNDKAVKAIKGETQQNESLNERLISRYKTNNLNNEQIKRMKLLAGITK